MCDYAKVLQVVHALTKPGTSSSFKVDVFRFETVTIARVESEREICLVRVVNGAVDVEVCVSKDTREVRYSRLRGRTRVLDEEEYRRFVELVMSRADESTAAALLSRVAKVAERYLTKKRWWESILGGLFSKRS